MAGGENGSGSTIVGFFTPPHLDTACTRAEILDVFAPYEAAEDPIGFCIVAANVRDGILESPLDRRCLAVRVMACHKHNCTS